MKKSIFMLGMALTACFVSCTDDDLGNRTVQNPVHTGDEILFGSTLSDNANMIETKTVYGDRTTTGVPVYWEDDGSDEIAIYCLQSSQPANHLVHYKVMPETADINQDGKPDKHQASSVTKVNTAEAGLQWGDPDTPHNFYAFYPASAVEGSEEENQTGKITAHIDETQQVEEWREGTLTSSDLDFSGKKTYFGLPNMDYAYMYAYKRVDPKTVDENSPIDLSFKNLVTVLDITIQGPSSGTATITNVNVEGVDGTILSGDFTCNIRAAQDGSEEVTATCEPVPSDKVRNRISIPCYDKKVGKFIQLGPNELLNVKAYIIPQDVNNTVTKGTLRITVSLLNGAPCKKTLNTDNVTPHKINRVILPKLEVGGTNYWMSSLDPDIYVSELSLPGSKMSYLTRANGADIVYQNATINQQLLDGVRAFIFHTQRMSNGELRISVNGSALDKTLKDALAEIATFLKDAESQGKMNETAFVMITYSGGGLGSGSQQDWMTALQKTVNECAENYNTYRIFDKEMTPDVTLGDVAGKIILKANYNSDDMIAGAGTAPMMYTKWEVPYVEGGLPMTWGNPNSSASLHWLYQEVTSVKDPSRGCGHGSAEATKDEKETYIKKIFQESVAAYNNDTSHKTWFMNDLGGYYFYQTEGWFDIHSDHEDPKGLATDMNNLGVSELQNRTENAGLGLVYMNFADKQENSGVLYKSDWLIQTIIDNNFKFALRKKGDSEGGEGTKAYNATYANGGNAIGWDK